MAKPNLPTARSQAGAFDVPHKSLAIRASKAQLLLMLLLELSNNGKISHTVEFQTRPS